MTPNYLSNQLIPTLMKSLALITLFAALTSGATQSPKKAPARIDPEVESAVMKVLDEYISISGWHHSKWDRRRIVHGSADKVHVDTKFTRYRTDGSRIGSYESLYILT